MKNFVRRICSFLMILTVVSLVGCGTQTIASPTRGILPTVTDTTMSSTAVVVPTTTDIVSPTAPVILLSENDNQYVQLTGKGYRLVSSGSLVGPQGFTYSAYLFINPDLSPLFGASESTEDTMQIAFYRWNGEKNEFLSVQGFPAMESNHAVGANVVDWDQPFLEGLILEFVVRANEETKELLRQANYSSDINQNGLPEFALGFQYCPTSCTHPTGGIQLFEIQNTSTVQNITESLPGLTFFEIHSKAPFTFYVEDSDFFDIYLNISSTWIYTWDGSKFVDVSSHYAEEYLVETDSIINDLKSRYGKPFDEAGNQSEMNSLRILKLYEKASLSAEGLKVFLDITDISHWANISDLSRCWLQISRAMAQEDFKQNRNFELPPSSSYWENNLELVKRYEEPLKQSGYDTSACTLVKP